MKKYALLIAALSLTSLSAFASSSDPCATAARAAAAAKTRASAEFKHWDPSGKEKAQIRSISVQIDDEGVYQVSVEFGLAQEDEGETGSADYSVGMEDETDGSCRVVDITKN